MPLRTCIALLLLFSACATTEPNSKELATPNPRLANLRRAAALPWADDGQCVVHEASNAWPVLVERCFHALDHDRIRFNDPTGRCAVASAGAAALGVGTCILIAPELVAGAVIITGTVVVAVAIQEELDTYERRASRERTRSGSRTQPVKQDPSANRKPEPEEAPSEDFLPPLPPETLERERRPECGPKRVPPKGGNNLHNRCANGIQFNAFRGANALVNGKAFDALQVVAGVLWEVKTDNFETYPIELQDIVIRKHVRDFQAERELAKACGFHFRVGVRSAAHKSALEFADDTLDVVLMDWCRNADPEK